MPKPRPGSRPNRAKAASVAGVTLLIVVALATLCATSGCSSIGYLGQSAVGEYRLLAAARPVSDAIADPKLPEPLRARLRLTQRMRDFAVTQLRLPDNGSYRSYADLKRTAAVWNVVATPELSLQLRTWCFPLVGCVGYRGYYDLASAEAAAAPLREQGLDVDVYPVPAYSTLGWMNWVGGDPLLNTFVQWPEGEVARLIFHELAHQVAYAPGDTTFNESFATAVERIGGERWLQANASADVRRQEATTQARRQDFRALVRTYRERLDAVYGSALPDAEKRARKAMLFAALRADYETMKRDRWQGYTGYDQWFATVNNAALGTQSAYDDQVDSFERLFAAGGGDFGRFYAEVKRLANLPRAERDEALAPYRGAAPVRHSSSSAARAISTSSR